MATERIVLPKWHFKKRIRQQYSSIPFAIAREIVQNSQDAGATRVDFTFPDGNSFQAVDNGCGMNLEDFRLYYLSLGGSRKNAESIGCFGAAKEILSFAWKWYQCRGQGFSVTGSGADSPTSDENGIPKGFSVAASDDGANGSTGISTTEIRIQLDKLVGLSDLRISVKIDGEKLPTKGRKLRKSQIVREFPFGTLYVHKSKPADYEQSGYLYIRARGLYTAIEYIGGDYVYYLDVNAASLDVLTENRDGLRYDVKNAVQRELQAVSRNPAQLEVVGNAKRIRLYGYAAQTQRNCYDPGLGTFDIQNADGIWRKPFALADDGKTQITNDAGAIRPKYAKALEIWDRALTMLCALTDIEKPMPGLVANMNAEGCHFMLETRHVVCALPDSILTKSPFYILELAMHELAHYTRQSHSQEYETERFGIASRIGDNVAAILDTIGRLQREPARRS